MSTSNTIPPGIGNLNDTFDFVKNMWSGMQIPGMTIPGMVMPTVSVDEVNKQIKDLKAVESWLSLNMNMLQSTIKALEIQSATLATLQSMSASFTAAMQPEGKTQTDSKPPFESPFSFAADPAKATPQPVPAAQDPVAAAPLANPAAWWNMLQDQFKQAVDNAAAMTPDTAPVAPVSKPKGPARKAAAKSASRKRKATPKA